MPEEKQKDRVFYITHNGELLIWLVVILVIVAVSSLSFITHDKRSDRDYRVFLPDVDGLIVGSPVRMMGVDVGYVTKIKPTKNEVYVKFILTKPDVYIPQGTLVTVEFSGMAASKSLELYLPDKDTYVDNSVPLITVNSPKRLRDAMVMLGDMYKKLGSIIYSCSSFGNKLDLDIENTVNTNVNISDFLKYSNEYLDETNEKANELRKSIEGLKSNGKKFQ